MPHPSRSEAIAWGVRVLRRFVAHGMPVYAAALAYRGLLALVPLTLLVLTLIGVVGLEGVLPRLTAALARFRPEPGGGVEAVPLGGLLSASVLVGLWSMATGARLLMRALNAAHEVGEARPPLARFAFSLVLLPALAAVLVLATLLLILTSRLLAWVAGWVALGGVVGLLGSWLRVPLAFGVVTLALSALYRYGPSVRPPWRAVGAGAALAVALWAAASFGFSVAVATVLDYGSTYGSLGAAVALLVYLHLSAGALLLGAEVSASAGRGCLLGNRPTGHL